LTRLALKERLAGAESTGIGTIKIVGGDNAAESAIAQVKNQMRRSSALGKISPKNAHIIQFASSTRYRLENPGMLPLLEA